MKVRATKMGFYKGRRYPGDVFDIPDTARNGKPMQLGSWMEPVKAAEGKAKVDTKEPGTKEAGKAAEGKA